jgi:hypothetical protein
MYFSGRVLPHLVHVNKMAPHNRPIVCVKHTRRTSDEGQCAWMCIEHTDVSIVHGEASVNHERVDDSALDDCHLVTMGKVRHIAEGLSVCDYVSCERVVSYTYRPGTGEMPHGPRVQHLF